MTSIAIVGERLPDFPPHVATDDAIAHSAAALGVQVRAEWVATDEELPAVDAVWCAPGSPYRSLDGALAALRWGRERGVPTLGTCGGCQHMLLEFGRNVLGLEDAQHAEYDPYASRLFVTPLTCEVAGRTMHVTLRASRLYDGATDVEEQYYCNFGLNPEYRDQLDAAGFRITGVDADGDARLFELDGHPFYVATLFVPQMRPDHPVVTGFLAAAAAVRA
jgi:CTP synthase (UTP-ammonia lyase)